MKHILYFPHYQLDMEISFRLRATGQWHFLSESDSLYMYLSLEKALPWRGLHAGVIYPVNSDVVLNIQPVELWGS